MKLLFAWCLVFLLAACHKELSGEAVCTGTALVRWGGDPAADGLGWHIYDTASGKTYIPLELPADYKIDNLPIDVCLAITDEKFNCECLQPLPKYRITSIHRK